MLLFSVRCHSQVVKGFENMRMQNISAEKNFNPTLFNVQNWGCDELLFNLATMATFSRIMLESAQTPILLEKFVCSHSYETTNSNHCAIGGGHQLLNNRVGSSRGKEGDGEYSKNEPH